MREYSRQSPLQLLSKILMCFYILAFISCQKKFEQVNISKGMSFSNAVTSKPNIVIILADDIGYEVPTVDGGQSYLTPNLDLMAKRGMRFTQCYASPLCSPSRIMMMTGKYSFRNYTTWSVLTLDQKTIANMLQDAGYDTYVTGKWQFDNGDLGVKTFGFDDYIIFEPFAVIGGHHDDDGDTHGRYKSPELYVNGAYLNGSLTEGKYCDDILVDSLTNYAARSASNHKPFFIYYPMSLCHSPFSPTPDDSAFATWDPNLNISDTSFFPSMVAYMDKKVGQVISRFDSMGLSRNTIFLFLGDNGTPHQIFSQYKDQTIQGGKGSTNVWGTNVPLIAYWKGTISPGVINNDLIDFTDILPTLAGLANIPVPTTYGTLDGVSFYPRLLGQAGTPRDWVFCHFDAEHTIIKPPKRYIQNSTYKLYDSTGAFYDVAVDPYELTKIKKGQMTQEEKQTRAYFQSVLDTLHN